MNIPHYESFFVIPANFTGGCTVRLNTGDIAQVWLKDRRFHRRDGPALIISSGSYYYLEGNPLSSQEWFEKLTREEQDAIIWNGFQF